MSKVLKSYSTLIAQNALSFTRKFSSNINPNSSITYLVVFKVRVLLEYIFRSISELRFRRMALVALKSLRGQGKGKKALVLGNGPSAKTLMDLDPAHIANHEINVFSVNFYPLSDLAVKFKPDYLVLSDPVTRPDFKDQRTNKLWDWIAENAETKVIVPISWWKFFSRFDFDPGRLVFFDDNSLFGWTRSVRPDRPRGYQSLTAYKALAVASYMEYVEIGILGFDNDMFRKIRVDDENLIRQSQHHFFDYEPDRIVKGFPNGIGDYFYDISISFLDLKKFNKHPILNLNPDSLVDAFPKKNLKQWLD